MDGPLWQTWGFWRRVLLFIAGAATIAGQVFALVGRDAQIVAYVVALVNLALSLIPDSAVTKMTRGLVGK